MRSACLGRSGDWGRRESEGFQGCQKPVTAFVKIRGSWLKAARGCGEEVSVALPLCARSPSA